MNIQVCIGTQCALLYPFTIVNGYNIFKIMQDAQLATHCQLVLWVPT